MKLEKYLEIKKNHKIWRLLINQNDLLLLETRDVIKKETFFSCVDLSNSETILKDFQFEEKFWLGIESFYNDTIFFHSFPKQDMPNHKEIFSFDIKKQKINWHNQDLSFLFCSENVIYAYRQGFEGKYYYSVDFNSGEIIDQLTDSEFEIIQEKFRVSEDIKYESYSFPEEIEKVTSANFIIQNEENIIGKIEAIDFNEFILISFNKEIFPGKFTNIFKVYSKENSDEIFSKILDGGIDRLAFDTFFIFKDLLFLIVEKNTLEIYKIEK